MAQQPVMPPQSTDGYGVRNEGGFDSVQPTNPVDARQSAASSGFQRPGMRGRSKKKVGCLIVLLVVVAIAIATSVSDCVRNAPKSMDWPTTGLAAMLPEPPHDKGEVISNSDTLFSADIDQCSASDFSDYVAACSEKGFTVEAESDSNLYCAYNSDGYRLSLSYWESSEQIDVSLEAPRELGELVWPAVGPASLIPAPASMVGSISSDTSDSFFAYVGETDKDGFRAYADECAAAGFSVDYDSGETWYRAKNAAGDSLSLSYVGFSVMTVDIDLADDASADAAASNSGKDESTSSQQSDDATGVTPEFKASMDEYEAFFDEYVEFMNAYAESDDIVAMAADYADMMQQYSETMDALDAIDENSLSDADLAYYLEVQSRISAKLLEINY